MRAAFADELEQVHALLNALETFDGGALALTLTRTRTLTLTLTRWRSLPRRCPISAPRPARAAPCILSRGQGGYPEGRGLYPEGRVSHGVSAARDSA